MARRTRRFIVLLYALPVLCALVFVAAGGPELALLLLVAPVVGAVAARVVHNAPAQKWASPRRRWKRSSLRCWQFRLRSLMLLMTGAAVICALLRGSWTGALVVACGCAVLVGFVLDRLVFGNVVEASGIHGELDDESDGL